MNIPLFDYLLLNQIPGLGAASCLDLMNKFGSIRGLLSAKPEALPLDAGAKRLLDNYWAEGDKSDIAQKAQSEITWCEENQVEIIPLSSEDYPALLKQIHRPPPLLYVRGDITQLHRPQLALVGSRKPSAGGLENAMAFGRYLAASGFTVTSGLALGIDGAAHRGALKAGGSTIAVLGCGIDKIYPYRHTELAEHIVASGGALVSEFPIGTPPTPALFPQRNRVISGLSMGVLVIEAALRSGSLITAREGLQQGREVFAIPGSIHNPQSKGCHRLLKDGATLVESAQDLVNELQGLMEFKTGELENSPQMPLLSSEAGAIVSEKEQAVLSKMAYDPISLDALLARTKIPVRELGVILVSLELKDRIKLTPYGYECLKVK